MAHGRRGTRKPGELRQRIFGHRLPPADQTTLRDGVLATFSADVAPPMHSGVVDR
jgi:hypothetical protein